MGSLTVSWAAAATRCVMASMRVRHTRRAPVWRHKDWSRLGLRAWGVGSTCCVVCLASSVSAAGERRTSNDPVASTIGLTDAALNALPFSFAASDAVSAPTRFWRDGRLLVTRTFRSDTALPLVAARLAAQMPVPPTLITVPQGLLLSGLDQGMWWSVHLQDAGQAGTYGTIVGSPMRLGSDGITPQAPPSPAGPAWVPAGGMRVLDTRAVHDTRCHIHQVYTFGSPATSTLGDFRIALDRDGWTRQPGSASGAIQHWQRGAARLDLIVVATDGGSGAVLHLSAPMPRTALASFLARSSSSSAIAEPPCMDP